MYFRCLQSLTIPICNDKECTGALHAPSATDHQHDDCYIWTDLFYNAVCRYHCLYRFRLIFYIDFILFFSRILQQYVKKDEADTDEL